MRIVQLWVLLSTIFLLSGCPKLPILPGASFSANRALLDAKLKEAEVKQGAYQIQLAVERYRVDNGSYPAAISALGPLLTMPVNPFTKQPMREVPPSNAPPPGEFSYLTKIDPKDQSKVLGYGIVAYSLNINDAARLQQMKGWPLASWPAAAKVDWSHAAIALFSEN